jgi:hypothetical protein
MYMSKYCTVSFLRLNLDSISDIYTHLSTQSADDKMRVAAGSKALTAFVPLER